MAADIQYVDAAILGGAFHLIDSSGYQLGSRLNIDPILERRFPTLSPEDIFEVIVQYELWRQGGDLVNRRTDNRTVYARYLPTIVGCNSPYTYTVVVPFADNENDTQFTKKFTVNSDVALGRDDVLLKSAQLAELWRSGLDPDSTPFEDSDEIEIIGGGEITAAARCQQ